MLLARVGVQPHQRGERNQSQLHCVRFKRTMSTSTGLTRHRESCWLMRTKLKLASMLIWMYSQLNSSWRAPIQSGAKRIRMDSATAQPSIHNNNVGQ